jgi:hypothetical protein
MVSPHGTDSSRDWKEVFHPSHFDEAGGRCWPGAQERVVIIPDAEPTTATKLFARYLHEKLSRRNGASREGGPSCCFLTMYI